MAGDANANMDPAPGSVGPDVNSPLYVHPSDYSKQLHVNETLNDHNYNDWSQEMLNFLFAKNKVSFVDGTLKKPENDSADHMHWRRADAMVKGWLTTAMEKEIRNSVKYAGTAYEIWSDLLERFGKDNAPRAYELKLALTNMQQAGSTVSAYFTKLRGIWDEIDSAVSVPRCICNGCTCDIGKRLTDAKDKDRLYEFLMRLDNEFGVIKTQILATKPTPSLNNAFHLVKDDENQRSISLDRKPNEAAAFKASFQYRRDGSGNRDATKRDKAVVKDPKRSDVVEYCTHCGRDGHNKDGCFKKIGYSEWWPGNKAKQEGGKAAYVEANSSPIPGLTKEQYETLLKTFAGDNNQKDDPSRMASFAGNEEREGE
ncbi:uncharacterized protein LOC143613743 [Bidens hawaiensis]|uniref:uncharacterized protein LOC143613743 n=1 Tax=Bidens hawaiensis TaxID=980011 RepID=UPI0040490C0D